MSERKPDWRDLNAYADGELLPSDAAGVARAVAEDPALADQVATLARLKATVQEQGQAPLPDEVAGLCRTTPQEADGMARPLRRTWAWFGAAAATRSSIVAMCYSGPLPETAPERPRTWQMPVPCLCGSSRPLSVVPVMARRGIPFRRRACLGALPP